MFKTPRKALGFKRSTKNLPKKQNKGSSSLASVIKHTEIKAAEEQKEQEQEAAPICNKDDKRQLRKAVIHKHAPRIHELAQKALIAVQELMAAESVVRNELGQEEDDGGNGPFSSDDTTLEQAEHAISVARFSAAEAISMVMIKK